MAYIKTIVSNDSPLTDEFRCSDRNEHENVTLTRPPPINVELSNCHPPLQQGLSHAQGLEKLVSLKQVLFHELSSTTQREMHNIIYELGADIIPLLICGTFIDDDNDKHMLEIDNKKDNEDHTATHTDRCKKSLVMNHYQYKQRMNSIVEKMELNLSKIKHNHRLFHYLIHKMMMNKDATTGGNYKDGHSNYSAQFQYERLMVFKFLSAQSEYFPNKSLIASYPGLLEALTSGVLTNHNDDLIHDDEGELHYVTSIICQLSKDMDNKAMMARKVSILDLLMHMLQAYHQHTTSHCQKSERGLCLTIETLMHLSEINENKSLMVTYKHKTLLHAIVKIVKRASIMSKTKSCYLGLQCIHNFICKDTIEVLVISSRQYSTNLCQMLVDIVMMECPFHDISLKSFQSLQKLCLVLKKDHDSMIRNNSNHALLMAIIQMVMKPLRVKGIDADYVSLELLFKLSKFSYHKPLIAQDEGLIYMLHEIQANDNDPAKRLLATQIMSTVASCSIAVTSLAKHDSNLLCQLYDIIVHHGTRNEVALRHEAMKAFLRILKDKKAASTFIVDRKMLPSLATFVCTGDNVDCHSDYDLRLRRAALKALIALTPMM